MAGIQRVDRVLPDEHHRRQDEEQGEEQKEGHFSRFAVEFAEDYECSGLMDHCSTRHMRLVGKTGLWDYLINCFTGSLDREKSQALLEFADGKEVLNESSFTHRLHTLRAVLLEVKSNDEEKLRALHIFLRNISFLERKNALCLEDNLDSALLAFSILAEFSLKDARKERILEKDSLVHKELLGLTKSLHRDLLKVAMSEEQKAFWSQAETHYKTAKLSRRM